MPLSTRSRVPEAAERIAHRLIAGRWWLLLGLAAVIGVLQRDVQPADLYDFSRLGGAVLHGQLARVYSDDVVQSGPLQLIASAALVPGRPLANGLDLLALHVLGGVAATAGVLAGTAMLRRVLALAPSAALELAVGAAALAWVISGDLFNGHLAQVATPVSWLVGTLLLIRDRWVLGALVLASSVGWEPWGVLAAPAIALVPGLARRLGSLLVLVGGVVALYLPFALAGPVRLFDHRWPISDGTLVHLLWPRAQEFGWGLRTLQGGAATAACLIAVLALRGRADVAWLAPLAAVCVRLLLDPTMFAYYWVAADVLALAGLALARRERPVRAGASAVLLYLAALAYGPLKIPVALASLVVLAVAVVAARQDRALAPGPRRACESTHSGRLHGVIRSSAVSLVRHARRVCTEVTALARVRG